MLPPPANIFPLERGSSRSVLVPWLNVRPITAPPTSGAEVAFMSRGRRNMGEVNRRHGCSRHGIPRKCFERQARSAPSGTPALGAGSEPVLADQ